MLVSRHHALTTQSKKDIGFLYMSRITISFKMQAYIFEQVDHYIFLHVNTSTHLISLLFFLSKRLIRNFALIGHSHAGKSSLAEWMLYDESIQKQMPTPGASSLDSDPVEASRHSSLFSHFMRIPHKKHLLEGKTEIS